MPEFHVAIIGAGLSGLTLALALHKQSISCTIYEGREAALDVGGGLMLTPNGLKVLQAVGICESLTEQAYAFDKVYVQLGTTGAIIEDVEYGNKVKYGTSALRVYRHTVLQLLLAEVRRQEIPVHFNHRLSHILSETKTDVTWQFADGSNASASILVGADGIHSTVRHYVAPGVEPVYGGVVTLVAAVPTAQLGLPAKDFDNLNSATNKHPLPSGIVVPQYEAFVFAPQTKAGDELMITVMRPFPDEPEHWGPIDSDKDRLRSMFRQNADKFPEVVGKAVANIPNDQLRIWPFYNMPLLESWTSIAAGAEDERGGRVVILGDAAHALPPSAGQGANQAFEDSYLLAGVLARLGGDLSSHRLHNALRGWQLYRQERVDAVIRLNKQMEIRRLPPAAQAEQGANDPESLKGNMSKDFDRLFRINLMEAVDDCLSRGSVE